MTFINSLQKEDIEDPWLHGEWAEVLTVLGRNADAGRHFQVKDQAQTLPKSVLLKILFLERAIQWDSIKLRRLVNGSLHREW